MSKRRLIWVVTALIAVAVLLFAVFQFGPGRLQQIPPPRDRQYITMSPDEIDGTEVRVLSPDYIIIDVRDHPGHWTGGSEDEKMLIFYPEGVVDPKDRRNKTPVGPAFEAYRIGTSGAWLENQDTCERIEFSVESIAYE